MSVGCRACGLQGFWGEALGGYGRNGDAWRPHRVSILYRQGAETLLLSFPFAFPLSFTSPCLPVLLLSFLFLLLPFSFHFLFFPFPFLSFLLSLLPFVSPLLLRPCLLMKAKLFANGGSQAVRLPAAFRFEGSEVEIERDPASGAVILRPLRPSVSVWLLQRAPLVRRLLQVLPRLAPAIAKPRLLTPAASVPPLGQPLLLDPAALGALLCGMDVQLDGWLQQGRCAVAAIHGLAIERALAALDEPLITAFVQQGLDLCISLPWTAACNRQLVAIEPDRSVAGSWSGLAHQDAPLPALLTAQAQASSAVLVSEL